MPRDENTRGSWSGQKVALESRPTFVVCWIFCPHGLSRFQNPCLVQLTGSSGFPCSLLPTCSVTSCRAFYSSMCTFLELCRHTTNICCNDSLVPTYLSGLISYSTSSSTLQSSQTGPFSPHCTPHPPLAPHVLVSMIPSGSPAPTLSQSLGILSSL